MPGPDIPQITVAQRKLAQAVMAGEAMVPTAQPECSAAELKAFRAELRARAEEVASYSDLKQRTKAVYQMLAEVSAILSASKRLAAEFLKLDHELNIAYQQMTSVEPPKRHRRD